MRILITGVGDAFTKRHFGSGALVEAPGGYALIDCGDLIHRALHEATQRAGWNVQVADINDIIITHLHGDHCNGLESFGFARRIQRLKSHQSMRPRLHASMQAASRLWERLAPAMHAPMGSDRPSTLADYFDVHAMTPERPSSIAGLTVRCRFTKHPIPTVGLILHDGKRSIGWSSDTPFDLEYVTWLAEADVIVHESNLGPAHSAIDKLNALPVSVRSKMRLIHVPDEFDPTATDIPILHEGDVLTL